MSSAVRSHSSSRPPPAPDLPHRARSTTNRPPTSSSATSSYSRHRSSSRSQSYDRRPPSSYAAFAEIARRDFENTASLAARSSRREGSRDRSQERPPSYRTDSVRVPAGAASAASAAGAGPAHHRRSSSRSHRNSVSNNPNMVGTAVDPKAAAAAAAAAGAGAAAPEQPAMQPKRRTMISTPTGQWALGKTIGAGSMGKVKIAKNIETGEQVSRQYVLGFWLSSPRN